MSSLLHEVIDPTYTTANLIVRMRSSEYIHQRAVIHAVRQFLAGTFLRRSGKASWRAG